MRMKGFVPRGGFTLIELLVTISIAVVLMTIAIPSFTDFLRNNRLAGQSNDLVLAFAYAKSEAVKRGVRVTVCSRATDASCAGSTTWDNGWLVFVDNDGGGTVNGADVVLQARPPLEGGNTMRTDSVFRATFQNTGFSNGFANTFTLCDSREEPEAISVILSNQGRARLGTDSNNDSIVEDGDTPPNNVVCP